ncbi:MAG: hypothetical protein ACPG4T_17500 [Nannocystaceae bacterium]
MQDRVQVRLATLKNELDSGKKLLADLDEKKAEVQATVLRISGAIQVLEELLTVEDDGLHAASAE